MSQRGPFAGRYRLDRRLGAGAHATVYEATHLFLGHQVAVKIQRKNAPGGCVRHEGLLLARLRHRAFVRVLDGGVVDDSDFIVLELLRGCTLSDALKSGPLPSSLAMPLALELVDAIRHAHGLGIVLCDVKPANLLVTEDRELRIFDLGIACAVGEPACDPGGYVSGTWGYVPPDVLETGRVDPRRDQYAAAVSVYQMLAGRLPFPDGLKASQLRRSRSSSFPPPPIEGVPTAIMQAISRAMSVDPDRRFCDVTAFAEALRASA